MHISALNQHALIFDLETVPDLAMIQRAIDLPADTPDPVAAAFGDRFLPATYHEVVAVSALRLKFNGSSWYVEALGAPSQRERSEHDLIRDFLAIFDTNEPMIAVGFNTTSFDLNVIRYRAMLHAIPAPGLHKRHFFYRYGQDAHLDLCDVLSGFDGRSRITLDATCRALHMPGKMKGMDGSKVADLVANNRFEEIETYAVCDVLATGCLWLRYQVFTGALSPESHEATLRNIAKFIVDRRAGSTRLHSLHLSPSLRTDVFRHRHFACDRCRIRPLIRLEFEPANDGRPVRQSFGHTSRSLKSFTSKQSNVRPRCSTQRTRTFILSTPILN